MRLDFFDDEIESIKLVDKETFRSGEELDGVSFISVVFPCLGARSRSPSQSRLSTPPRNKSCPPTRERQGALLDEMLPSLENGTADNGWLMPFFPCSDLSEFLPQNAVMVWDEPKMLSDKLNRTYDEFFMRIANLLAVGEILPSIPRSLCRAKRFLTIFCLFHSLR